MANDHLWKTTGGVDAYWACCLSLTAITMQCGNEFYNFWKFRDFVYGFDVVSYNMSKYHWFEQRFCNIIALQYIQ